MATYTYTDDVYNTMALQRALVVNGVYDGVINIVDDLETEVKTTSVTTASPQANVDAAIVLASAGGLLYAQGAKIDQVIQTTGVLAAAGVTYVRPSDGATKGPFDLSKAFRTEIRNLKDDVTDGLIAFPQMIDTMDGRGSEVNSSSDVDALYQSVMDRAVYLVGDGVNGDDNSKGQALLIKDILAETTVTGVNSITDTRT